MSMLGKIAPLRSILIFATLATGSVTASGAVAPFLAREFSRRNAGSFYLTANPSSMNINQGSSSVSVIAIVSVNGFRGTVLLSAAFQGPTLPARLTNSFVNVPSNGRATTFLNVTAPITAALGSYNVVVTGTQASSRRNTSSSTALSVAVTTNADFAIYAQPYSITELVGSTTSASIVVKSLGGFNGTVSLYATVPFGLIGVMGGQNSIPLSAGGTASTTLQIFTTMATQLGSYNITVTGTSGTRTHSCVIILSVVDPTVESLTLTGFSFISSTNLTVQIKNNGNTTVTLLSYSVKDFAGDAWNLANWSGPVITPGSTASANILVGASCSSCTYTWVLGLWVEFAKGQTYTVVVTTTMHNQFSFRVTY